MVHKKFEYKVRDTYRQVYYRNLWKIMLHSHDLLLKDNDLSTVCGQIKGYMNKHSIYGKFPSHRRIFIQMSAGIKNGEAKERVLEKYKVAILNRI